MTQPEPDGAARSSSSGFSRAPVVVLAALMSAAVLIVIYLAGANGIPVSSPPLGEPGTAAAPRAVNVIMRDYHFDPAPLYLYSGETIQLTVVNAGMVEHELVLGDTDVQAAWLRADAAATAAAPFATAPPASVPAGTGGLRIMLASGGVETVTYQVPASGVPLLSCNLPGHAERGMVGQVVLKER